MKIGILTQPLHNNYGGLLQNYALQTILNELGHEAYTINIKRKNYPHPLNMMLLILKRLPTKITNREIRIRTWSNRKESEIISMYTNEFVEKNIKTTRKITSKLKRSFISSFNFDAYIVGSDQVWRPKYSPQLSTYFLDFLIKNSSVKKISYAASFGVSDWEFNKRLTNRLGKLLQKFDAVSVREDSGVVLCESYFKVDAIQVLDPTMLLSKEIYTRLVNQDKRNNNQNSLFTYILDKSKEKNQIVNSLSNYLGVEPFYVMQKRKFSELIGNNINDSIFPPVGDWLKAFIDASFVLTDSFHGTVFAILFNKPFLTIANHNRGLTRFTSLLKLFQLEDRLVYSSNDIENKKLKDISWDNVNKILETEKAKSLDFLKDALH